MSKCLSFIFVLILSSGLFAADNGHSRALGKIAVVKGSYDDIETVLLAYKIKYDRVQYRDLENPEIYKKYDSFYFPCGIEPPVETSINLLSRGANIQSVSLQKDYHEVDKERVAANVKEFIDGGGSAYFSGYSYILLQKAYDLFSFYDNFPYMGLEGKIDAKLKNDLERFCLKNDIAMYMGHSGWIAIKSVSDAEVLAEGSYETPRGMRTGPISFLAKRGEGQILFTSYHSNGCSDFRRFNVYRTSGIKFLNEEIKRSVRWTQKVTGKVVDALHKDEAHRMYQFPLSAGTNTLYLKSDGARFQIDIYSADMDIIESRDSFSLEQEYSVKSSENGICYVKIYPQPGERYGVYAMIMTAGGLRLPQTSTMLIIAGAAAAVVLLILLLKAVFRKRYLPWIRR